MDNLHSISDKEEIIKKLLEKNIFAQIKENVIEALKYSDEEIRDTLSPEEAEEFIQERRTLMESFRKYREEINRNKARLAAEDPAEYKKQ